MPEEIVSAHDSVLAELYAKRDEIEAAISAILFLKGAASVTPESGGRRIAAVNGGAIPSNAFFGLGIGDAAKKYLELIQAKKTLLQIVQALQDGGMPPQKPNTVYAALRRRESVTGDITRAGEEWGLKEWFSNIAKPKANQGKKTKKSKKKKAAKKTSSKTPLETAKKGGTSATEPQATKQPKPTTPVRKEVKPAKAISMVNAVYKILTDANLPLHADVLVEKLKQDYGRTTTGVKSIAASLPDDSTQRFVNIGGNTWALTEWPASKKVKAATA
jgi:DNA-directed RNA polymerase delta subunit